MKHTLALAPRLGFTSQFDVLTRFVLEPKHFIIHHCDGNGKLTICVLTLSEANELREWLNENLPR